MPVGIEQDVLSLNISEDDVLAVEVLQSEQHLAEVVQCHFGREALEFAQQLEKVTAGAVLDDEVVVLLVGEGAIHLHDEWVAGFAHNLVLSSNQLEAPLRGEILADSLQPP